MATSRGGSNLHWRNSNPATDSIRGGSAQRGIRGGRGSRGGRGGRGGGNASTPKRDPPPEPDIVAHPLGELLQTIRISDLSLEAIKTSKPTDITDLKYVASYNWMEGDAPTIMIPGKPPAWTPLKQPLRLKEDAGTYFRDPNGAQYPRYPAEPAVQAILNSNPTFPTSEIDIFACGSTMGNLLRFVRASSKAFRFSVEVVGKTVFFVRKENSPKEVIENIHGFGHSFPEAYTTWEEDTKGSSSHQRIVQYNFGGLVCVMRFECDGYLRDGTNQVDQKLSSSATSDENDNIIVQALKNTSVSHVFSTTDESLSIKTGGNEVHQQSIFDLKTRSGKYKRDIDMSDFLPVLWLKQIPNFIIAYHDGAGLFRDIRVQDIRNDLRVWGQEHKDDIQQLAVLLNKITKIATEDTRGLLEVYCAGHDLEVRRQHGDGVHSLPHSLRAEWEGMSDEAEESDDSLGATNGHGRSNFSYGDEDENDSSDEDKDFTACSADTCGYCGTCSY
ncbi:hypothetical protein K504DRAFT_498627 [Pleomassaria siparia CBS 279.74]|uniref:Geranylgeranyl pyrophosphate synthetase n=1 Tax=Pleomassaria siparia CBS 279.74 TaxID=1314801 RepID=A0A6G1KMH2_9PLEO|nr:hypothetical protein K504DRAFT_498627 [Pleomassaria siparia CBS 279.74]